MDAIDQSNVIVHVMAINTVLSHLLRQLPRDSRRQLFLSIQEESSSHVRSITQELALSLAQKLVERELEDHDSRTHAPPEK